MHRRIAPMLLAVLIALPVAGSASAAEPAASPSTAPGQVPAPTPGPTAEPAAGPIPSPEPTPAGTADPGSKPLTEPSTAPVAKPTPEPIAPPVSSPAPDGRPDATGRYIVMLRNGSDTAAVVAKVRKRDGVQADRSYLRAFRGFSAKLDKRQRGELAADPNVLAVVPDGVIQMAQTIPTGVSRVGGRTNGVAAIDGADVRVDADVAIVDTGITPHPDLNVAGGYNCSSANRTAWHDNNNHGTHVAGTVAALDNSFGVVGIAPGARVWGVKILNADGYGLISWYICGLDWILAQRDPNDSSRPLFEAVNMSVTKAGSDDHNCGLTNKDPLHRAICRVVAGGITVVAAAANDHHNAMHNIPASYDEVITVSALADTDGKPGGLGGHRCFSWGGFDVDDTFADFSNYGADVDIMAPGKCILSTIPGPGYAYMSGTSMAAPTVTGAVALYKSSRPKATPAEVRDALRYLGNLNWNTATDPDKQHEPLLDVSRIGPLGTFSLKPARSTPPTVEGGSTVSVPVKIVRSPTFFERVALSVTSLPAGWTGAAVPASVIGWTADIGRFSIQVPKRTPPGIYEIGVKATNEGRTKTATLSVEVVQDLPTAQPPSTVLMSGIKMGVTSLVVRVVWPVATDPSSPIAGYQVQRSLDGVTWASTVTRSAAQHEAAYALKFDTTYRFRVRARDTGDNWSLWVESAATARIHPVDDRSSSVIRRGTWLRQSSSAAWHRTLTTSRKPGASLRMTFTGHSVAVVGPRSLHQGRVRVYIDGVYTRTINMRTRSSTSRVVVFARYFPAGGRHTIALVAVGTGRNPTFRLDAFVVSR
jgi:subtilisin family serine protease